MEESTRSHIDTGIERGLIGTSYGYIHYRALGAGRPVVMLHAAHRSSEMFIGAMQALASKYRCLAIDLPGCGCSDAMERTSTVADYATAAGEVLEALGMSRVVALGQAVGAYVAVELATAFPGLVRGLILQNCPFYSSPETAQQRHALRRSTLRTDETGFPLLLRMSDLQRPEGGHAPNAPRVPTQAWVDEENRGLVAAGRRFWEGLDAIAAYDLGSALERVDCPTLLLWGQDFVYTRGKEEFERRLRDSRTVLIPEAGFFLQIDNPAAYEAAITAFLRDIP